MSRRTAIIGAPTAIGISPYRDGGARQLHLAPGVLRELGLAERLGARDFGDVTPARSATAPIVSASRPSFSRIARAADSSVARVRRLRAFTGVSIALMR